MIFRRFLFVLFAALQPGVAALAQSSAVTSYATPGSHSFTVPAGTTAITVKAWGAGGMSLYGVTYGGGGGYVQGAFAAQAGDVLTIWVGRGAGDQISGSGITAVKWTRNGVPQGYMVAGGGGSSGENVGGQSGQGGAGGGTVGGTGGSASEANANGAGGSGGSQSAGGAAGGNGGAGSNTPWTTSTPLTNHAGGGAGDGSEEETNAVGGTSGSGYYAGGGGGGAHDSDSASGGGGGGGSSYIAGATSTVNTQASGRTPANTSDTHYISGRGYGGNSTTNNGASGLVVLVRTGAPIITSNTTASGTVGTAFSYTIAGTDSPTSFGVAQALPAGLSLNTSTGVISGTPTQPGAFYVTMQAINGTGTGSATLLLSLVFPNAPTLLTQLSEKVIKVGENVTWSVTAAGTAPLSYQWKKNGVPITGATSASLNFSSAQTSDTGTYSVTVSNAYGAAVSNTVPLSVYTYLSQTTYTSSDSYTVPAGTSLVKVQAWGAGGDGGGGVGGGGGYASADLRVSPGDQLTITVGSSGQHASGVKVFRGGSLVSYLVAGAGGQGGGGTGGVGGAGGGESGGMGNAAFAGGGGGGGGGAPTGGLAGGYASDGEAGASDWDGGGGGGDGEEGYAYTAGGGQGGGGEVSGGGGGGGGGYYGPVGGGGGGGGSSRVWNAFNEIKQTASGSTPANTTDASYVSGKAYGGQQNSSAAPGLLVLRFHGGPLPEITSTTTVSGMVGTALSYSIMATNSPSSLSLTGTLPSGVSFNATTGVVSGTPTQGGTFAVTLGVTNVAGSASATLTLIIGALNAPTIVTQPLPRSVFEGAEAVFTVAATGPGTFSYQWRKNGTNISGATAVTLVISNAQSGDQGSYSVIVTNANGSTASDAVSLVTNPAANALVDNNANGIPDRLEGSTLLAPTGAPIQAGTSSTLELKIHQPSP